MKSIRDASRESGVPESLIKAVFKQLDYTGEELESTLRDVANHGADGGFNGFIYTRDTVDFFKRNAAAIRDLISRYAEDQGVTKLDLVKSFRCFKNADREMQDAIGHLIYRGTPTSDEDYNVANCLAWFALEEVARAYND